MSSGSFKNVTRKLFANKSYMYIYVCVALHNPRGLAQSVGALEYTDCISVEELDLS